MNFHLHDALLSQDYPAIKKTEGFSKCSGCIYTNELLIQLHNLGFAIYSKKPNLAIGWSDSMHWGLVKLQNDTFKGVTDN
jgi:hypothetical protein